MRTLRVASRTLVIFAIALVVAEHARWNSASTAVIAASQPVGIMPIGKPITIQPPFWIAGAARLRPSDPPTAETIALWPSALFITTPSSPPITQFPAPPVMVQRWASPIAIRFPSGWAAKKAACGFSHLVINSAYNTLQFWDGRAPSLEEQAEGSNGQSGRDGHHPRRRRRPPAS